jgi:hypothetical protein
LEEGHGPPLPPSLELRMDKALGLSHIDILLQRAMKECI